MSTPSPVPIDELLAQAGWVRRLAGRLAREGQCPDDLAQGTLAAALETPPREGRSLRPWLAKVAANLARKERRGAARRHEREQWYGSGAGPEPCSPGSDQLLAELEEQQRIARLAADLAEPYRTVILLRYYRGQSSNEIAAALGVPAATVRSRLARGLEQLRLRMKEQHGGDSRQTQGAFLLAAGLRPWPPNPAALAPVSTTTLALSKLALMSSNAQTLVALGVCTLVVGGVLGWYAFGKSEPVSPAAIAASPSQPADLLTLDPLASTVPEPSRSREGLGESSPAPAEDSAGPAQEASTEQGPTSFVARALDEQGRPLAGARFHLVDQHGVPRSGGQATESGEDGVVRIELPRTAFFTYVGREVSNVYMALGAPGRTHHFFVPAARLGTTKDLGDIPLKPGASASGRQPGTAGSATRGSSAPSSAQAAS